MFAYSILVLFRYSVKAQLQNPIKKQMICYMYRKFKPKPMNFINDDVEKFLKKEYDYLGLHYSLKV